MFRKIITFENLDGETVSKEFYFHLSKTELLSMSGEGDEMIARIKRIIDTKDIRAIVQEFRELVKLSVGVRSEDGSQFLKTPEAQSQLLDSPAFDELLMELCTNAGASAEFVNNLIPKKMQDELQARLKAQGDGTAPDPFKEPEDTRPAWEREHRHPTDAEVRTMDKDELIRAMRFRATGSV